MNAVLKVGEPCTKTDDCVLVARSTCDSVKKVCACTKDYPVDGGNQCGQGKLSNKKCNFHAG